MKKNNLVVLSAKVPLWLRKDIDREAKLQSRTRSNMLEIILLERFGNKNAPQNSIPLSDQQKTT